MPEGICTLRQTSYQMSPMSLGSGFMESSPTSMTSRRSSHAVIRQLHSVAHAVAGVAIAKLHEEDPSSIGGIITLTIKHEVRLVERSHEDMRYRVGFTLGHTQCDVLTVHFSVFPSVSNRRVSLLFLGASC